MIPASAARWRYHSRQRCQEQLFRVPAGPVSAKGWVGGAVNDRFALGADLIVARIVSVTRGAAAEITRPGERHRIAMLACVCHDHLHKTAAASRDALRSRQRPVFTWGLRWGRSSSLHRSTKDLRDNHRAARAVPEAGFEVLAVGLTPPFAVAATGLPDGPAPISVEGASSAGQPCPDRPSRHPRPR